MSFITWEFLLFFCSIVPLTFIIPRRLKIFYLLGASYLFYFLGNGKYVLLLALSTLFDYRLGLAIKQTNNAKHRRVYLAISLSFNLGLLILLRYITADALGLISPLGLSFYTFTKIGYVIDIYQRKISPETKFMPFATTIAFFPNITAGPIEKVEHLRPQLNVVGRFDEQRTIEGLRLILWGTFQKVVIANHLASIVDVVYARPQVFQGGALIIATLFFAFQIYADFSGYTNIAIGIARIFGVDLFENFRQPYFSRSILEFWRRWHMSLTNWVRSYLFFPFTRKMLKKTDRQHGLLIEISAYLIVMTSIGLWHGINVTFVVWGFLHGIYMSVEAVIAKRFRRDRSKSMLAPPANMLLTFLLVTFAWVFFRAENIADALYILTHLFEFNGSVSILMQSVPGSALGMVLSVGLISLLIIADWLTATGYASYLLNRKGMIVARWAMYYAALIAIWIFQYSNLSSSDFIYFQF